MEPYLANLQDNLDSAEELFRLLFPSITGKRKIEEISSENLRSADDTIVGEENTDFALVEWEDGDIEVIMM
jgi:hypothetical protein